MFSTSALAFSFLALSCFSAAAVITKESESSAFFVRLGTVPPSHSTSMFCIHCFANEIGKSSALTYVVSMSIIDSMVFHLDSALVRNSSSNSNHLVGEVVVPPSVPDAGDQPHLRVPHERLTHGRWAPLEALLREALCWTLSRNL